MATLSTTVANLADWAKRRDPDGTIAEIVELLNQTNDILTDMLWRQGNTTTGHRTTVRTGLPTVAWRLLNQAVAPSKSTTAQVDEGTGMLEAWSEVDVDLAKLEDDVDAFRLSEGMAFLEALSQEMAQTFFYGNSGLAPEEFLGLTPRYSAISGATNASNVISAGGTGSDNMSIWVVGYGPNTVFGIFPKGSQAGIMHEDNGQQIVTGTTGIGGTRLKVFSERWQWKAGLCVRDWRYAVRICNIDVSDTVANTTPPDLTLFLIKAIHRLPNRFIQTKRLPTSRAVIYMNRTAFEYFDVQGRKDVVAGGGLTYQNVDGEVRPTFRGIPVAISDQLLETEAQVT